MSIESIMNFDFQNIRKYSYGPEEFAFVTQKGKDSNFDQTLKSLWQEKVENNCFRYTLSEVQTRIIPGKYGFVAQLNTKRATQRRTPQLVSNMMMKFDKEKFHFGKVDQREILFQLLPKHWEQEPDIFQNAQIASIKLGNHVVIINVSPLEDGNCLLVPYIDRCYPQMLNYDSIRLAIETLLLSHNPDLRIGMNSLGGYASVNHLHFHMYYLKEVLYLQHAPVKHLAAGCWEIVDYPAEGFAFQLLREDDYLFTAKSVNSLVGLLQMKQMAYNIFMTRGKTFDSSPEENGFNAIRIFIWARKSSFGIKDDTGFNTALCELAGHLPIKEENFFKNVKEEDIAEILREVCHEPFIEARAAVIEHDNFRPAL